MVEYGCGIVYGGTAYCFLNNLQGDVIAITDTDGNVVGCYRYDAWGACTIVQDSASHIANINPFRYRGYYYDSEIGMYYLQSRYYDPETGRFVNADEVLTVWQYIPEEICNNFYSYCKNIPIADSDRTGFGSDSTWSFIWLMIKNTVRAKVWKCLPVYGQILFYKAVNDWGVWDYKWSPPSWAKNGKFTAFGITITTEQLGNFNFGFTGAAMGFSPATLFAGGGYVAIKHNATWKDWKYFFDQKQDHLWIGLGILAYSVYDRRYRCVNSAYKYALEKKYYSLCLAIYKYFR